MQSYADQEHFIPAPRRMNAMPNPNTARNEAQARLQNQNTMLRIIRDQLSSAHTPRWLANMNESLPIIETASTLDLLQIPTTEMHVDTKDDQWAMQPDEGHIYSRYTTCTPPPPLMSSVDLREDALSDNPRLQAFYETARQNAMRERLLTLIGTQRTFLLERRNELQQLQQQAAALSEPDSLSEPATTEPQPRRSFLITRPRNESIQRDIPVFYRGSLPITRTSFELTAPNHINLGHPYIMDINEDLSRLMLMNPNDIADRNANYTATSGHSEENRPYGSIGTTIIAESRRSSDEHVRNTRDLEAHFAQWRQRTMGQQN